MPVMKPKFYALICARGGSKGIPGKNIKNFHHKPLLQWILEAAVNSSLFEKVILSTDCSDIASVGEQNGAFVPGLRPSYLSDDNSDQFDVHKFVFDQLDIEDETHIVCILNNNPFIDSKLILEGYNVSENNNFNGISLDTACVDGDYSYFKQCEIINGIAQILFNDAYTSSGINRQSLANTFVPINNIRWGKPSFFRSYTSFKNEISQNGYLPFKLPKLRNFDLDTPEDWKIAETVFKSIFLDK
jgi:pseudaminic acid cytidylyltransferase